MEEGKDVRWDKGRAHWSTGSAPNPHAIPPCGGGHAPASSGRQVVCRAHTPTL